MLVKIFTCDILTIISLTKSTGVISTCQSILGADSVVVMPLIINRIKSKGFHWTCSRSPARFPKTDDIFLTILHSTLSKLKRLKVRVGHCNPNGAVQEWFRVRVFELCCGPRYLIATYFLWKLISRKWNRHISPDFNFEIWTNFRENCQNIERGLEIPVKVVIGIIVEAMKRSREIILCINSLSWRITRLHQG